MNAIDYLLIASSTAAYVFFSISLFYRREKFPGDLTLEQAFVILEKALKKSHQGLPEGFTWTEALKILKSRLKRSQNLNWKEIETALKTYEEFRYGGLKYSGANIHSIVQLVRSVRKSG